MTLAQFAIACTLVAWAMVFLRLDRRVALALFVLLSLVGAAFVVLGGLGYALEASVPPDAAHRTMLLHGALILAAQLVGFMRLGARSSQAEPHDPRSPRA